ncbi:PREDICTED: putative fatty acyl-CoA reductase CG5065 [Wasmannia auropunctata]|uniref:putative fatty acyl-CoA reductase CG5065 n=1 Tax=Wasmannia auropunctata TaxID=64793 RepID=UPI0005EDA4F7|nr:PREDICTED: putative fatty acyl-CoA reductase CG5065 [Wasmannia auropunctata]
MGTTNAQTNSGHAHDEAHSRGSSIDTFFAETVILLTGATGFLGKALLEKLLRSCPRVATIFVLIRPKKGQTVEERFKELLNNPVFERIRSEFPGALNKIFPVKGDVGLPELGLEPEDRDMLIQRVNIVFHGAATVRFNEPLKIAVNLNTMGTDRMLDLCKRMTNLISVIHVSTAYSNADRREIDESIYIWGEFGYLTRKHAIESPSKYVMWYPDFTFRTNKFIHAIIVATLHFVPAFIVDLILRAQGCKPIMVKITKRFERAAKTGEFFAMNEWKFYTGNMMKLVKFVRASGECGKFDVDIGNVDWDVYLHQYMLGIRKYILKDNLDTLNNARNRLSKLYWMHKCTKILSILVLLGMIRCAGR